MSDGSVSSGSASDGSDGLPSDMANPHGHLGTDERSEAGGSLPFTVNRNRSTNQSTSAAARTDASTGWIHFLILYLTLWHELRTAEKPEDKRNVRDRLKREWRKSSDRHLAVLAIHVAVYNFPPDTIFRVPQIALDSLTVSAIFTAATIFYARFLLWKYGGTTALRFMERAGVGDPTYLFFAINSRLPLLTSLISLIGLVIFTLGVAYSRSPAIVVVTCVAVAALVILQLFFDAKERVVDTAVALFRSIREVIAWQTFGILARASLDSRAHAISEVQDAEAHPGNGFSSEV
ncbi:hypothetical protein PENSPDRAFT_733946 [Peniophora sp. CONT]|nr:hypothetical protein PENSPDRAFT_733946 [Peniophora sp. CONT]